MVVDANGRHGLWPSLLWPAAVLRLPQRQLQWPWTPKTLEKNVQRKGGHFKFWLQLWTVILRYIKLIVFHEESNAASTMRHETTLWQVTLLYALDHKLNMEICSGSGSCLTISTALSSVNHPTVWAKLVSLPCASKSIHSRLSKNLPEALGIKGCHWNRRNLMGGVGKPANPACAKATNKISTGFSGDEIKDWVKSGGMYPTWPARWVVEATSNRSDVTWTIKKQFANVRTVSKA